MIVINVDELRWDGLGITGHPFVDTPHIDQIAREGMLMKNSFVVTPLCGPSRGCLMTGQYAHTNGSYKNTAPKGHTKLLKTYPMLFQKAGYETAFIGKWTTGRNAGKTPHPGFDRWFCSGVNRDYKMDPVVNVDGEWVPFKGHSTLSIRRKRSASFARTSIAPSIFPCGIVRCTRATAMNTCWQRSGIAAYIRTSPSSAA